MSGYCLKLNEPVIFFKVGEIKELTIDWEDCSEIQWT